MRTAYPAKVSLLGMYAIALVGLMLFLPRAACGQDFRNDIPVYDAAGNPLRLAWAGGMSAPQVSNLDLDGDGIQDLFVFDRKDNSVSLFLQRGAPGQDSLVFAPQYLSRFPIERLSNWVLLADANCDGRVDLFTDDKELPSTILLFEQLPNGTFTDTPLRLRSNYQGFHALLYSSNTDMPGLADIDGDGDLDILTFDVVSGERVFWHRNYAQEELGRCDTLLLRAETDCYGRFREQYDEATNTFTATLNQACATYGKTSHVGGALLPVNLNGDTLMDLLFTDNGPRTVMALTNGGTRTQALMTAVEAPFPQADVPIHIDYFPALYSADVNGDGLPDLLAAPNETVGQQDRDGLWCYLNAGGADSLVPQLYAKGWLQQDMIELGTGAMPTFYDLNGDGHMDMLVANQSAWQAPGAGSCLLHYYQNTGDAETPAFTLQDSLLVSLSTNPELPAQCGWRPALARLHADSRTTMVLGSLAGSLTLLTAAPSAPTEVPQFTVQSTNWLGVDALVPQPSFTQPVFYDVDGDGDLDLVVGTGRGRLLLYENTGTATQPDFALVSANWGGVWVRDAEHPILGYAAPAFADIIGDGRPELIVGNRTGNLLVYRNLSMRADAVFDSLGALFPQTISTFARPAITQLHSGSDSLDIAIGTARGGVHLLRVAAQPSLSRGGTQVRQPLRVYPNPATTTLHVHAKSRLQSVRLRDIRGSVVASYVLPSAQSEIQLGVSGLPSGIYLLEAIFPDGSVARKRVVKQ